MAEVHIVEPTLADQAGHCHGYVQSLVEANSSEDLKLHVWLDRRGDQLYSGLPIQKHTYFSQRWRQYQKWWCLRSLLRDQKHIFIPTAGRIDLLYLNWLLRSEKHTGKIFLHFHQFRVTDEKIKLLKKIAKRHPEFIMMAPTEGLLSLFQACGFSHCEYVPCPSYAPQEESGKNPAQFEKVIFAGAARSDKGFSEVVRFAEYITERSPSISLEFQISPPHSGRYDKASEAALSQLKNLPHPHLVLHEKTLDHAAYQALYVNAIGLLIYDPTSYRHKFSGIALDAFYAGCPVIAMADTWAGDTTKRFEAGIVITERSPEDIFLAMETIRKNYLYYHHNAKEAGRVLQKEHDPRNTWRVIKAYLSMSDS
ncbi:MAG TPA: glycosyltransferase [Gammaproteobacteria bacterium]|nr:glycosyltransferase [Gammaproteobacteria bacterium]